MRFMAKQNNTQKGETIMKKNKSTAQTTTNHKEEVMNQITFKVEKMYRLPDAGHLKITPQRALSLPLNHLENF